MERRGRGSFPCAFFAKDGFCAKGRHCEFVHERPGPCKHFFAPEGCRFGDRCMFSHSRPKPASSALRLYQRPDVSLSSATPETTAPVSQSEARGADPWGFGDAEESVYFYGAAGGAAFDRPKRYSEVVGQGAAAQRSSPSSESQRKVCGFFRAGYCMFGDRCRNLHPEDQSEERVLEEEEEEGAEERECGICMSVPRNRVFGLLNNCSCVFCLDCIKNWRKEGLTFEDATQVR